jgi:hypothetical protein
MQCSLIVPAKLSMAATAGSIPPSLLGMRSAQCSALPCRPAPAGKLAFGCLTHQVLKAV